MSSESINRPVAESIPESVVLAESQSPVTDVSNLAEPEVRILRTVSELEELRAVWTAWGGNPGSELDFLLMLLRSREEILNPHVIVVYRSGKPDAILVGRLERTELRYRLGYLPIFKATARVMRFQYEGLRGNPSDENCKEIIAAILKSLKSSEADVAILDHPRTDSFLYKRALSVPGLLSRDLSPISQPHHLMRLPATIEEVYLGLSSLHRKHLRGEARKLEKKFDNRIRINCFRAVSELEMGISQVEEIARKTYHRKLNVGFQDDPQSRQILQHFAANLQLRMYVLLAADVPIAFWIGYVHQDWFYAAHTGFDPLYRNDSPGAYLLVKIIEDSCRERLRVIDFGLGDAPYKHRFGNQTYEEATVQVFAPTIKGLVTKGAQTVTFTTNKVVKKILARTKLLVAAKRLWRDRLVQKNGSK